MADIVHCVFVEGKSGPLIVNLSREFGIASGPDRKSVSIARNGVAMQDSGATASLTVLYGENGSGKTKILLDIATLYGDSPRHKRAGVLFERDGALFLRRGAALQNAEISAPELALEFTNECPACASLFYTSSPFESARRNTLLANGAARDVSPTFGGSNEIDGPALLAVQDVLNDKEFVGRSRVGMRLKLLSVADVGMLVNAAAAAIAGAKAPTPRTLLLTASKDAGRDVFAFRCWLSMAIALAGGTLPQLPKSLAELLAVPNSPAKAGELWEELKRFAIRFSGIKAGPDDAQRLFTFIELANQFPLNRALSLGRLRQHIDETLLGRWEELRRCTELKLVEFSMSGLSSGETAFVMLFSALYGGLERLSGAQHGGPVFLLIDEGEMFMHPAWQREYIGRLLTFLASIPGIQTRVHLLLATHSLIVAGDAPANRLLNVETGELGNAFGLGPRGVLERVYGVAQFHGTHAESELARIESFLSEPNEADYPAIDALIQSLADKQVAAYLGGRASEALARRRHD